MRCWQVSSGFLSHLGTRLSDRHRVVSPTPGRDGLIRLCEFDSAPEISTGEQPLLSLKKYLFPAKDTAWRVSESRFEAATAPDIPLVALGLPPCDIYAVTQLDNILGEDPAYRIRRKNLVLIGARCTPEESCHCLVPKDAIPGDLFLDGDTLWATSSAGEELLASLDMPLKPLPEADFPTDMWPARGPLAEPLADRFAALNSDPLWERPAADCLACGACSAVCPTCSCYDLVDIALPGEGTERERRWDNCLFSSFAQVAGGHDFRPGSRSRLQFRMQHKLLGFGEQIGTPSCVGCGRCERHCPVDIGPRELLERLQASEEAE